MIQIQPVVFPLNLGTANRIQISINSNIDTPGARISYSLLDTSDNILRRLSNGYFDISEEDFATHGNDKDWVLNYVVMQLGITLI